MVCVISLISLDFGGLGRYDKLCGCCDVRSF